MLIWCFAATYILWIWLIVLKVALLYPQNTIMIRFGKEMAVLHKGIFKKIEQISNVTLSQLFHLSLTSSPDALIHEKMLKWVLMKMCCMKLLFISGLCNASVKSSNTDIYSYGSCDYAAMQLQQWQQKNKSNRAHLPKKVTANPSKTQAHFPRKK